MILKSRLYREEVLRWCLVIALASWALLASAWALSKKSETLLIAIGSDGARLVSDSRDLAFKTEATEFLKAFLGFHFNFNESTHKDQIGRAADLMSAELWERERPKLLEIDAKLKTQPLTQSSEIESIDMIGEETYEATLAVAVRSRLSESKARVKVTIVVRRRERTRENPWAFEVKELKDEVL